MHGTCTLGLLLAVAAVAGRADSALAQKCTDANNKNPPKAFCELQRFERVDNVCFPCMWGGDTAKCHSSATGTPCLQRKMNLEAAGADVKALQDVLKGLNLRVESTGRFDRATEQAVKDFQASKGLKADGIVGPRTLEQLLK